MITSVIFDLNGTILSDEDEYGLAFKKVLNKLGVNAINESHEKGVGLAANWKQFIKKYKISKNLSASALSVLTQKEYLKLSPRITLTEGFLDFINLVREAGKKTALATSNDRLVVGKIFERFGIGKYFDVVTTGDEVKNNKPDPEIFLLTAKKLGTKPVDCLVFEDSNAGIKAAKDAGMKVFRIGERGSDEIGSFADFTQVKLVDII